MNFPNDKVDGNSCLDMGKSTNETENATTSDTASASPNSDMLESEKKTLKEYSELKQYPSDVPKTQDRSSVVNVISTPIPYGN